MQPEDFLKSLDERAKVQNEQAKQDEMLQLLTEIRDLLKKEDNGTIESE